MQRCPTCNQTYPDDAPGFCPHDGARLLRDDASSFDPQKTVMGTTPSSGELAPAPPPPPQPAYNQPSPQWAPQPPQSWPQPQPPPAQNWGGYQQQQPPPGQYAPYAMPYPQVGGKRKILGIVSIVFGGLSVLGLLLMLTEAIAPKYRSYYSSTSGYSYRYRTDDYQILAVIVTVLGAIALVLGIIGLIKALKTSARFGGKEMAIAGMATGVIGAIVALISAFS